MSGARSSAATGHPQAFDEAAGRRTVGSDHSLRRRTEELIRSERENEVTIVDVDMQREFAAKGRNEPGERLDGAGRCGPIKRLRDCRLCNAEPFGQLVLRNAELFAELVQRPEKLFTVELSAQLSHSCNTCSVSLSTLDKFSEFLSHWFVHFCWPGSRV